MVSRSDKLISPMGPASKKARQEMLAKPIAISLMTSVFTHHIHNPEHTHEDRQDCLH